MPSEARYEAAIDDILSYIEDYHFEFEDRISEKEEEDDFDHIVLTSNGGTVYITAQKEMQYFVVRYPFSFVDFISNGLDDEIAEEILANEDQGGDDMRIRAATKLLERADSNSLTNLKNRLRLVASGAVATVSTESRDNIPLTNFEVTGYMFPFESDFSFKTFAERVQAIRNAGGIATDYVHQSTRLVDPEESESGNYEVAVRV